MSDDDFYMMIIAGLEVDSAPDDDEVGGDESSGEWGKASLIVMALAFAALFWLLV